LILYAWHYHWPTHMKLPNTHAHTYGDTHTHAHAKTKNTKTKSTQKKRRCNDNQQTTVTHFGENKRLHLESSKQNYYIISLWVIIKAIFTSHNEYIFCWAAAQNAAQYGQEAWLHSDADAWELEQENSYKLDENSHKLDEISQKLDKMLKQTAKQGAKDKAAQLEESNMRTTTTVFGKHCECIAQKCTHLECLPPLASHLLLLSHCVLTQHGGQKKWWSHSRLRESNQGQWWRHSVRLPTVISQQSYPMGRTVTLSNGDQFKLQITACAENGKIKSTPKITNHLFICYLNCMCKSNPICLIHQWSVIFFLASYVQWHYFLVEAYEN